MCVWNSLDIVLSLASLVPQIEDYLTSNYRLESVKDLQEILNMTLNVGDTGGTIMYSFL